MATIDKGVVSALKDGGAKAEIIPSKSKASVTAPLVIDDLLRGNVAVNDEVVYVMFEDNTGVIFLRIDGKNNHKHTYTHGGTSSGNDETGAPVVK